MKNKPRKKVKKPAPLTSTINILKGKLVSIITDQISLIETEDGAMEQTLTIDGLFIHCDGDNFYLNTKSDEPNQFNMVVPKATCKLLTVITEKNPEPLSDKVLLN